MSRALRNAYCVLFLTLTACATFGMPGAANHSMLTSQKAAREHGALPPNLLYVAGGPTSEPHPFIEVFNALDSSPSPQPLYTIAPVGGGSYGRLAVDGANDLFAENYFANGVKLVVFPSGKTRPKVSCLLDSVPQGIYIANNVLYLATRSFTIEEYSLPILAGRTCPKPISVLTDQRAQLRGEDGLWALAVDPGSNIFDIWIQANAGAKIDEFPAGSMKARRFAPLPNSFDALYLVSDSGGNLVTSISGTGSYWDSIAMFPHGSHTPERFQPIPNGTYFGFALAHGGTELFAVKNYPTTEVEAFRYDSRTGKVGNLLRSFTDVWYNAESIAVYSRR